MSDSPFPPFNPSTPPATSPETPKQKAAREKREAKAAEPAAEPRQKRKNTSADKPSLKFDLQTILSAAKSLNEDDMATFEKIVGLLSDAGKPGRERLLAAIGKIFE